MNEALITGIVAIAVCMINNFFQNRTAKVKHNETISLIEYKIDELTKRVDKHNNVIERTFELEKRADVFDEKINGVNEHIEDLERE